MPLIETGIHLITCVSKLPKKPRPATENKGFTLYFTRYLRCEVS